MPENNDAITVRLLGGTVEEMEKAVKSLDAVLAGTTVSIKWTKRPGRGNQGDALCYGVLILDR